jgi:hypothetical protein
MGWLLARGGDGWSFGWRRKKDCGDGGREGGDKLTCPVHKPEIGEKRVAMTD